MRSESDVANEIRLLKMLYMNTNKDDRAEIEILTALKYLSWVLNENMESPIRLILGGGGA